MCYKSTRILLRSSKCKFFCFFKKVPVSTELHLAELMSFQTVTTFPHAAYFHITMLFRNGTIFLTPKLRVFSFCTILHQHPRNTHQRTPINCQICMKDYKQNISKEQLMPGTCPCCEIPVIIFCWVSEAMYVCTDKLLNKNENFILKNPIN